MEKSLLLSIIHASEDIDAFTVKIKNDSSIERCKLYLEKCLKISYTIESFLNNDVEMTGFEHEIEDIIDNFKIAINSKSINEIHSKVNNCISSNSIIYANLIDLYES